MDVWIVEGGLDYEGTFGLRVRSTAELAEQLRAEWEQDTSYDWVTVTKHTVDEGVGVPDYSSFT